MVFIVLHIACYVIIRYNTLVHPYLLADNRHYTFYVWKRFFEVHDMAKYAFAWIYILGGCMSKMMLRECEIIFQISFYACLLICVVPQKLLA